MYVCLCYLSFMRQTQAERRATTRDLLINATLDILTERGWAGVTSVAVCKKAGLTRGAFVHHFDGLPEQLAAALEHRCAELNHAFRERPTPTCLSDLVKYSWETLTATDFKVVIEAWLAAANDPGLREAIAPVIERFSKLVTLGLKPELLADESAETFYLMARETLFGLALGRATNRGPVEHEERVINHLLRLATEHDALHGHEAGDI